MFPWFPFGFRWFLLPAPCNIALIFSHLTFCGPLTSAPPAAMTIHVQDAVIIRARGERRRDETENAEHRTRIADEQGAPEAFLFEISGCAEGEGRDNYLAHQYRALLARGEQVYCALVSFPFKFNGLRQR